MSSNIQLLFEGKPVRRSWDIEKQEWLFSIVDVIAILTETDNPRRYWSDLKRKLKAEGADQLYEKIVQLKLPAADGKSYKTDAATMIQLFRLIQSIPSPKAEPLKVWLAQVGVERIKEENNPELAIQRGINTYAKQGYSREWIATRLKAIEVRNKLTDEWQRCGTETDAEYASLTDAVSRGWSCKSTGDYKRFKGLSKYDNLRDNMSQMELALNILAETTTMEISQDRNPTTFGENLHIAVEGGLAVGEARKAVERVLGKSVITPQNARDFLALSENHETNIEA